MGVSNTQIATHSNVANKRIHNGFSATYATTATKCVYKGRLEMVEFLEAKDRTTTSNIYYGTNTKFGTSSKYSNSLVINNNSFNQITYSNVYYENYTYDYTTTAYCSARAVSTINAYSTVTIGFNSAWPGTADDPAICAIFTKQLTGITTGLVELKYTLLMQGIFGSNPSSSSGSGNPSIYGISNPVISHGVIVTDSNGQIIAQATPYATQSHTATRSLSFSTSTSTINVHIIVPGLSFDFYATQSADFAGFQLKATTEVKSYASRYDLDTKCVQYQDINHPSGKTFTIYYGVWNNKGSNAKLNNLYVQIKKTTDSSWTTIGTAALPSSLNKSTTGSVTCTLPTTYDPKVQYDFRVTAGETNSAQQWYYRWGTQSSLTTSGYSWTKYSGSAKTGVCPNADGLNTHSTYSTLRNYNFSSSVNSRGRSTSTAALFCIE